MEPPSYNVEERNVALVLRGKLLSIAEILQIVGRAPLPVRAAIQELESRGMVEIHRMPHPDEDKSIVKLTAEGDNLAEQAHAEVVGERYDGRAAASTEAAMKKAIEQLSHNSKEFFLAAFKAAPHPGYKFHLG